MGAMVKHGTMAITSDIEEQLEQYRPDTNQMFRDQNGNQLTPNGSIQNN